MKFPNKYKVLNNNSFVINGYSIVPIRYQDRYQIMNWRNEQMYHLRQANILTKEGQDYYFEKVISETFKKEQPSQILFSYLKNDECIGYGGLVHINWVDMNAEISFIMKTELEHVEFDKHWKVYLSLIEKIAFQELKLYKIFTYAFDLRPQLYKLLEESGLIKEAVLKKHCHFNGEFKDVIIHSKFNEF